MSEMAKFLELKSPVGSEPMRYEWPLMQHLNKPGEVANEIIETILNVCCEIKELNLMIQNYFAENDCDITCYESMRTFCDKYNKSIEEYLKMNRGTSLILKDGARASRDMLRHIIRKTYNYAVIDPDRLNQYQPFSAGVYGETSFEFIDQMINEVEITPDDVFIDLGSGVGQVVLQMAAATNCRRCIGIEKASLPSEYADTMTGRFIAWMKWHGKRHGEFELMRGDFFDDKYRKTIEDASFIFVNNFAFGPTIDHQLKMRFGALKHGAKIVSSREFAALDFKITKRSLNEIGAICHVKEIIPKKGSWSVSWTGKPVSYYLHLIDPSKLERYFEKVHKGISYVEEKDPMTDKSASGTGSDPSTETSSNASKESNGGGVGGDGEENFLFGPMTRRSWLNWYHETTSVKKSNSTPAKSTPAANRRENAGSTSSSASSSPASTSRSNLTRANKLTNKKSIKLSNKASNRLTTTINSLKLKHNHDSSSKRPVGRPRKISSAKASASELIKRACASIQNVKMGALIKSSHLIRTSSTEQNSSSNSDVELRTRPGRPKAPLAKQGAIHSKKDSARRSLNTSALDIYHSETLKSISLSSGENGREPAPGCVDEKLSLYVNRSPPPHLKLKPTEAINGSLCSETSSISSISSMSSPPPSTLLSPGVKVSESKVASQNLLAVAPQSHRKATKSAPELPLDVLAAVDDHIAQYKRELIAFMVHMQSSHSFKERLVLDVEEAKMKNRGLKSQLELLEKQVTAQQIHSMNLLKRKLGEIGLPNCETGQDFTRGASHIISTNKDLKAQESRLISEILQLEQQHNMINVSLFNSTKNGPNQSQEAIRAVSRKRSTNWSSTPTAVGPSPYLPLSGPIVTPPAIPSSINVEMNKRSQTCFNSKPPANNSSLGNNLPGAIIPPMSNGLMSHPTLHAALQHSNGNQGLSANGPALCRQPTPPPLTPSLAKTPMKPPRKRSRVDVSSSPPSKNGENGLYNVYVNGVENCTNLSSVPPEREPEDSSSLLNKTSTSCAANVLENGLSDGEKDRQTIIATLMEQVAKKKDLQEKIASIEEASDIVPASGGGNGSVYDYQVDSPSSASERFGVSKCTGLRISLKRVKS